MSFLIGIMVFSPSFPPVNWRMMSVFPFIAIASGSVKAFRKLGNKNDAVARLVVWRKVFLLIIITAYFNKVDIPECTSN
ncbi:hypothetical protein D3C72_1956750 [compost metagenome]